MNVEPSREKLLDAFPMRSILFDEAVDRALERVHNEAVLATRRGRQMHFRRMLSWGLALLLLLAGALGVAEGVRRGVFDFIPYGEDALPEVTELIRQNIASMHVGQTELTVTEAIFDGSTLRFVMSVRCPAIERPLSRAELWEADGEFSNKLSQDGVTAMGGFDWFLLNGCELTMTSGSGGEYAPGEENGEALICFELNLSEVVIPEKDLTISLPVGRDMHAGEERILMDIPVERVPLESIRDLTPMTTFPMRGGELTVLSAKLSPIRVYLSIRLDFSDEVPEDDVYHSIAAWQSFALVDADGREVCPRTSTEGSGLPVGETDSERHLWASCQATPAESYPERLFLAPVGFYAPDGEWGADMSMAVELTSGMER